MNRYEKEFTVMFWLHLLGAIINLILVMIFSHSGKWVLLPVFGLLYNAATIRFMYVTIENTRLHDNDEEEG